MVEGKVWCSKQEIGGKLAHLRGFSLIGRVLLSRRSGVTDRWARADTCFWRSLIFKCSSCVNANTWGNQPAWREWRVELSVPISLSVSARLPLLCLSGVRYNVMFSRLIKKNSHKITMKNRREVIFCLSVLSGWSLFSVSHSSVSLCFNSLLCGVIRCLHLFVLSLWASVLLPLSFLNGLAADWDGRGPVCLFFSPLLLRWHALSFLNQNRLRWNEVIIFPQQFLLSVSVSRSVGWCFRFMRIF